jgi:hypothetical protein
MKKTFKILGSTILVLALIFDLVSSVFFNSINEIVSLYKAEPATITAIVITLVTTAISYILAPKPPEVTKGILVSKTGTNNAIPVVYGQRQVAPFMVYLENSGDKNTYLYMVGVLCEGEIESIDTIFIDDKEATWSGTLSHGNIRTIPDTDENFYKNESLVSVQCFYGKDDQVRSTLIDTNNWTDNHKLSGFAYVAFKFKFNQNKFGGIPTIRVLLKGRKIYDPRLDSTRGGSGSQREDDKLTWTYSANSSLVLLDYLRNSRFGKGIPNSAFETNYLSFVTSANTCDTKVTPHSSSTTTLNGTINSSINSIVLTNVANFPKTGTIQIDSEKISYTGRNTTTNTLTGCTRGANSTTPASHTTGATVTQLVSDINLFETHAYIDTDEKLIDNVRTLLVPMRAIFNYLQGKYKVLIEGTGSSQLLLTKDNVVSEVTVQGENKAEKYNRVIGTFSNPDKSFQSDTVCFPPYDDSALPVADQYATLLAEDNGTILEKTVDMTQITSPYQAEEICENILKRSRNCLKGEVTATAEALNLSIGDIITATYSTVGWVAKPFRVMGLTINSDSTVNLSLEEHQDNFYTWESKNQAPTIPDTVLPNPFSVLAPVSLTLSDQLILYSDGVCITAMDITIGASEDAYVDYYQVEYKLSTETDYLVHTQGKGLFQRILNVKDGELYNVRVKAVNTQGVSSDYTTASRTIIGGIALPSDVEDFTCNIVGQDAHLNWTQIPDLDLAHYIIRYSTATSGATWTNSVTLIEKVARPATSITVPARIGSYLIVAQDKSGNISANASIIATNLLSVGSFNAITTQTESPTFAGTKTNLTLSSGELRLTSLASDGIYQFSSPIDLGKVFTSRVTASITQYAENSTDLFDSKTGLFDSALGSFDGDAPAYTNAHLEIALSDDGVTYSSFRNFVISDYTSRFYKFKLYLTSLDGVSTPVVSALSVTVDMPDRIFSGNDIVSGTGTKSVTFTLPFYSANYAVGITAQGMATGDYFLLTNKTVNGFDVAFKNSAGTGISKQFDFMAKGF